MRDFTSVAPPRPGRYVQYVDGAGHWCGESPTDTAPVLYLSASMGTMAIEASLIHSMGLDCRCLSYGYLSTKAVDFGLQLGNYYGSRLFLDSGAFTLQKQRASEKQIQAYLEGYARFLRETYGRWDWYAGVDYRRDCALIRNMQAAMHKLGVKPTPVYHGDSSIDWFRRYCQDGYKLIAIGRPPKHLKVDLDHYYGKVFDTAAKYGVRLHGLQETGTRMFRYPWWSVDSSSWLFGSAQGLIFYFDESRQTFASVYMVKGKHAKHWHTSPPELRRAILGFAERFRITEEMLLTQYVTRNLYNAAVMSHAVRSHKKQFVTGNQWKPII